jgi:hypothetical protein
VPPGQHVLRRLLLLLLVHLQAAEVVFLEAEAAGADAAAQHAAGVELGEGVPAGVAPVPDEAAQNQELGWRWGVGSKRSNMARGGGQGSAICSCHSLACLQPHLIPATVVTALQHSLVWQMPQLTTCSISV